MPCRACQRSSSTLPSTIPTLVAATSSRIGFCGRVPASTSVFSAMARAAHAPVIAAVLVGYDLPKAVGVFLAIMPSSHAMQLATDGLTGQTYFGNSLISVLLIAAWGVSAYGLLWARVERREA